MAPEAIWRNKAEFRGVTFKPMDKDVRIFVGTLAHNAVMEGSSLFKSRPRLPKAGVSAR